jgi:pyruvate, water dikinase
MPVDRFPYASETETPAGAEGWQEMYSWYHLSSPERAPEDDARFWFHDALHHPDPLYPYDEIHSEAWWHGLGAFNTRIFAVPPAYGVDQRIVNGYLYITPVPVPTPEEIAERAELYRRRAGHYYENWDGIYEQWKAKVTAKFDELRSLNFQPLPRYEDESVVFEHRGYSSGFDLIRDYDRLILGLLESVQYHFELLNVGYAAYLAFFEFAKQAFAGISDQTISRMVGGLKVALYRPDDELKRLAGEAERLGIGESVLGASGPDVLFDELRQSTEGREWLSDWEATSDPWFRVNTDAGHPSGYHTSPTWLEDQRIPLSYVKEYVRRLRLGEDIARPRRRACPRPGVLPQRRMGERDARHVGPRMSKDHEPLRVRDRLGGLRPLT